MRALIVIGALLLASCQPVSTMPDINAGKMNTQSVEGEASFAVGDWRSISLGTCCEIFVPADAVDASGGQLVDSDDAARFQVGTSLITADLRTLPGLALSGPRRDEQRNVTQAGINGVQNRLTIIVQRGPPGRQLAVNVTCEKVNCALADEVLSRVRVN